MSGIKHHRREVLKYLEQTVPATKSQILELIETDAVGIKWERGVLKLSTRTPEARELLQTLIDNGKRRTHPFITEHGIKWPGS